MAQRYPREVQDFIVANTPGRTTKQLTAMVNERFGLDVTPSAMRAYKINHHLKSGLPPGSPAGTTFRVFTEDAAKFILANYHGVGYAEMAKKIQERFGLTYTVTQMKSFYSNHHLNSGLTGRFEKGFVPANKGKKGWSAPGTERTRFPKGHLPATTKPIGYERVTRDGYTEVKVRMRPSRPNCNDNFAPKHRLIWEATHGPIPPGHVIIFKDGNPQNFDLDNLAMVTKAERLVMARKGLFSSDPKLTETGIAIAKVKTAIYDKRKGKKSEGGEKA